MEASACQEEENLGLEVEAVVDVCEGFVGESLDEALLWKRVNVLIMVRFSFVISRLLQGHMAYGCLFMQSRCEEFELSLLLWSILKLSA